MGERMKGNDGKDYERTEGGAWKLIPDGGSSKSTDTLREEMTGSSKRTYAEDDLDDKPDDSPVVKLSKASRRRQRASSPQASAAKSVMERTSK